MRKYVTKTVYVAKADERLWERTAEFCYSQHIPVSQFVADALKWYLERLVVSQDDNA